MADKPTPTDAELDRLIATYLKRLYPQDNQPHFERAIMRAVLAKWGQPVGRVPLTDEQIKDLQDDGVFLGSCRQIVRAIEAEHGIKGGQHEPK